MKTLTLLLFVLSLACRGLYAQKKKFPLDSLGVYAPCVYGVKFYRDQLKYGFDFSTHRDGWFSMKTLAEGVEDPPTEENIARIQSIKDNFQQALREKLEASVYTQDLILDERGYFDIYRQAYFYAPRSRGIQPASIPDQLVTHFQDHQQRFVLFFGVEFSDKSAIKNPLYGEFAKAIFLIVDLRKEELHYGKSWEGPRRKVIGRKNAESLIDMFYKSYKMYKKLHP